MDMADRHDAANQRMSHLLIGLSLALVGSVALNASYLIQHAGSVMAPTIAFRTREHARPAAAFPAVAGRRRPGITGWVISIAALTQAPLSLCRHS